MPANATTASVAPGCWPRLLTIPQAAYYTAQSETGIKRAIARGEIRTKRLSNRRVAVDRLELDAWADALPNA